ncbi:MULTISPECIES: DUF5908 family protein [Aquimarina]|uniref:DUF5908 family protein n=1 Tax=Aquimarina TaxID=290174 RepID=UPI00135B97C6|nr:MULTISPECIES: DUF5908 family protein [Aquimarina]
MAVEIKEIVIRAVVSDTEQSNTETSQVAGKEQNALVQECVQQVLKILKKKNLR